MPLRRGPKAPGRWPTRCLPALAIVLGLSALAGCSKGEVSESACPGSVAWSNADSVEGEDATVRGKVAGASYRPDVAGEPTFVNVGKDYPSSARFTIVIWGEDRDNFATAPEDLYDGAKICATGPVREYDGLPQMTVTEEDQVVVVG